MALGGVGGLLGFVLIAGIYMLPTIIAYSRKVTNLGSVFVINFFLGWTFVGWIVALAMAARSKLSNGPISQVTVVTGSNVRVGDPVTPLDSKQETTSTKNATVKGTNDRCQKCGDELPTGASFCVKCGAIVGIGTPHPTPQSSKVVEKYRWCGNCKKELPPNAKFCNVCGTAATEIDPSQCRKCKGSVTPDDKFCLSCGTKID